MEEDYLSHHGILGQKWGVRRYQNSDGSLTAEGRKRRGLSNKPQKKSLSKKIKDKAAKKMAETEADRHEKLKRTVRDHPEKLYKHRYEFSDDEIAKLVTDINTDTKLKDIRDAEIKCTWDKVQRISNNIGTVKNLAYTAKDVYNLAADVQNSMVDYGKMTGPKMMKIGQKPEKAENAALKAIINSGDRAKVLANAKDMDANQLQEALRQIDNYDKLNKLAKSSSYDDYRDWVNQENKDMLEKAKNGQATTADLQEYVKKMNAMDAIAGMARGKNN